MSIRQLLWAISQAPGDCAPINGGMHRADLWVNARYTSWERIDSGTYPVEVVAALSAGFVDYGFTLNYFLWQVV
jgi:hypothetical protein